MTKLKLIEVKNLEAEVFGYYSSEDVFEKGLLLKESIPFPLKFRIETKLKPIIEKAVELIAKRQKELALANGAKESSNVWQFELNDDGSVKDKESFNRFNIEFTQFIISEENEIEIDVTFKLSSFSSISDNNRYPVLCKLIVDDLD